MIATTQVTALVGDAREAQRRFGWRELWQGQGLAMREVVVGRQGLKDQLLCTDR